MQMSNRAWAELILLSLLWGASFLAIAIALRDIGVVSAVAHRVSWAAAILWAVVLIRRIPVPRDPKTWIALLVMGLLNNVVPFGLITWGQVYIESGLAGILNASTAIFGALTASLLLPDERLTPLRALGVGVGFAGVLLTIGPAALSGLDPRALGQIAVLGAAVSYALAAVWAKRRLFGLAPEMAAAGMLTGSSMIAVPAALMVDGVPRLDLAVSTWMAIAYYAVFATAGAYLLYYRVLALAGSANLMLVTLIIPPIAILLGWLVLDETLPPTAGIGLATIALGLLILDGRVLQRFGLK
ncbi:MAG: DMT family transporter [Pseudomonadota bacterium]